MAGSTNIPRTGWLSAIRGSFLGRNSPIPSGSAARWNPSTTAPSRRSGAPLKSSRPSPTTRRWWAGAASHVNTLRLWRSRAPDPLRLDVFNAGDYVARPDRAGSRRDPSPRCCIQATRRPPGRNCGCGRNISSPRPRSRTSFDRHLKQHGDITKLPDKVAIQLNDTHPAIAVAELMRLLVDSTASAGSRPGASRRPRSPTPTTRCCPRRWKPGRCR